MIHLQWGLLWHLSNQKQRKTLIVDLPDIALDNFNNGKELYFKRIGKMNLACSSCHLLNSENFSEMSNYLQQLTT